MAEPDPAADEGSSGCLWGCLFALAGLAFLFLVPALTSSRLADWSQMALGVVLLCRLIPGLPPRWFGPQVVRTERPREFWVILALGTLMLVAGIVEACGGFGPG